MKTLTVGELIKQLRRHPDKTPVFLSTGRAKTLRVIQDGVRLHVFENKLILRAGKKLDGVGTLVYDYDKI